MDKKTALIIMYASNILFMGWIGWLIAFLAGKKEVVGGRSLTTGLLLAIIAIVGSIVVGLGPLFSLVFGIIGLVKVLQGDEDPVLPLIGNVNWFK